MGRHLLLTVPLATSEPPSSPWVRGDDPTTGEGYEPTVAPGPKTFDVDVNQFSIDPQRTKAVDFSSPYDDVVPSVVTTAGSKAASATSIDDLKGLRLGAQVGSTSLTSLTDQIDPTGGPSVYDDAIAALRNEQVDAIVADLPTAFFMSGAQLDDRTRLGDDITDPRVDADVVRRRIGVVFQAYNLFLHLSVLDDVTFAPRRVHRVGREQAEGEAMALLERIGLRDKAGAYPTSSPGARASGPRSCGRSRSRRGCCCSTR